MCRREWLGFTAVLLGGVVIGLAAWLVSPRAAEKPLPVTGGDQELAWLHTPTSFEAWENFVWAAKRAEMPGDGGPEGLRVDDSGAFPEKTTAIPEVVIRRDGYAGALRIRWYKTTDAMPQESWVAALAERAPAPVAVVGGWSSDRAVTLAEAMRDANWKGPRPLLLLTTATADRVESESSSAAGSAGTALISVYNRSFRFCFTNRQMAEAVTDFVLSDPTLRPGPLVPRGVGATLLLATAPWAALLSLHEPITAFAIEWKDDPYSTDLSDRFREALLERTRLPGGCPQLLLLRESLPFSTGRLNRPTPAEAEAVADVLAHLPPRGTRTLLVIPTVSAPARRTLRTLVQGNPDVGKQVVAVTGDGISVNTFFRDREFAWPVRSIKIPFVSFAHADPFAWDSQESGAAPPGYELAPPAAGELRSTTEELRNYNRLVRVVSVAMFAPGSSRITDTPDALAAGFRGLEPAFFDSTGDRRARTGEHVVVIRPAFPGQNVNGKPPADGTLEVYTRKEGESKWSRRHTVPLGGAAGRNP